MPILMQPRSSAHKRKWLQRRRASTMRRASARAPSGSGTSMPSHNPSYTRSGTVRVRAVFENRDGSLMPGQYVKLRMGRGKSDQALLVSERAIGTDQNKRFVMVVGDDNKATYREVTLGATVNGQRLVASGLKSGERIIVNGLQRSRPGTLVAPQPASESTAAR